MKNTIFPLFAYPVVVCGNRYEFSDDESRYLDELEMTDNIGNSMSKDDKVLDNEELAGLRQYIDEQVTIFKKSLLRIKDDNEIYVTQSWVNVSRPGDFHPRHRHPNSIISGVMYLDDNGDGQLPPIRFHRTLEPFPLEFSFDGLNEFNATCRVFEPEKGMLILFPSLLEHDVERNKADGVRRSLSFNTFVRGVVGGSKQLTEVDLG